MVAFGGMAQMLLAGYEADVPHIEATDGQAMLGTIHHSGDCTCPVK
jgi:hypothetical protein